MPDEQSSRVSLRSPHLTAEVSPLGAQLFTLRDSAGRDLLWHGDATFWAGRAPILFPIVGSLAGGRYRLGDRQYSLSRHGFARGRLFETVSTSAAAALFRLRADDGTLAVYPFPFVLDVGFALEERSLSITASVKNEGAEPMPASIGFHPGFRWPLPYGQDRAAHAIWFETEEPDPVRRINADGLLTTQAHATPVSGRRLALTDELFRNDVLILDRARSRRVRYGTESGPQLEIAFPDSTYLGLWTKPGAPFICIEPWQGVTDPAGFTGDFREKPGVFEVPPGGVHSMTMEISLDH